MKRERKSRKPKSANPRKRSHEDEDPMDDFDVPDICLGGPTK